MNKLILSVLAVMMSMTIHAATIIVDRADDLVIGGDGGCDLREAVNSANLNFALEDCTAGDDNTVDVILIDVDVPIQLSSEIDVIGSVLIARFGSGPKIEILAAQNSRHFHVNQSDANDDDFALVNLHLKDGSRSDHGGSIWIEDSGKVELVDSVFENNEAPDGGAIFADGSVVADFKIQRNHFINNRAVDNVNNNAAGGALYGKNIALGSLLIEQNLFQHNEADFGGAIYLNDANDIIEINRNRFYGNLANDRAGAIYFAALASGQTYATERNVFLNNVSDGLGGAIYGFGAGGLTVVILNSTFAMNYANEGGAIATIGGNIQVKGSTLAHNAAVTAGAQAYQLNGGTVAFAKSILAYGQLTNNCSGNILAHLDNIDDDGSCGFDANDGNIVADPKLSGLVEYANANPDIPTLLPGFELTADSPAIDYEDNFLCWIPPGDDLNEGQSRDVDGDNDGTASCDLGALEAPANTDLIFADSLGVY